MEHSRLGSGCDTNSSTENPIVVTVASAWFCVSKQHCSFKEKVMLGYVDDRHVLLLSNHPLTSLLLLTSRQRTRRSREEKRMLLLLGGRLKVARGELGFPAAGQAFHNILHSTLTGKVLYGVETNDTHYLPYTNIHIFC
jgi:hypothetical protein